MKLHGNVYDLKNGWYQSQIYNLLPNDGKTLDGHYTILFSKDAKKIKVYKHGDYESLISYKNVEFKGFLKLNPIELEYIKSAIKCTMAGKMPYEHPDRRFSSEAIFDYPFDVYNYPVYWGKLPVIN